MKESNIEWCDHTFNPWEGCTRVSPGCANCYAEARNSRWNGGKAPNWGPGAPRRLTSAANWRQPILWNREAEAEARTALREGKPYQRPRVFCASLADWLDEEVPVKWRADLLDLIRQTPALDWLLLTKRPGNFMEFTASVAVFAGENDNPQLEDWMDAWVAKGAAPANVWIGTTVEDQRRADERIPKLLEIPARVRFLSCEPLLGPVLLGSRNMNVPSVGMVDRTIDWVIAGGESGPKARPMHPAWPRGLRDQCAAAGVAFFFKQWGEWLPGEVTESSGTGYRSCADGGPIRIVQNVQQQNFGTHPDRFSGSLTTIRVGKNAAGRLLDGVEHNEFPGEGHAG
jgi:protein gp37